MEKRSMECQKAKKKSERVRGETVKMEDTGFKKTSWIYTSKNREGGIKKKKKSERPYQEPSLGYQKGGGEGESERDQIFKWS